MKKSISPIFVVAVSLLPVLSKAQNAGLYQYGISSSFLGGLFHGQLSVREYKKHGDFGIGAPDMVDGEVVLLNGKIYQTKASGQTIEMPDTAKLALGFACFFKPDTSFVLTSAISQADAVSRIDSVLRNKNAIYAIRISGVFSKLRTRAFYRVDSEPFPPIATLIANQRIFDLLPAEGTLVGFKIPDYWNGINIVGYHFHFIDSSGKQGGHVLEYIPANALVEIEALHEVEIQVPEDKGFADYPFRKATQ